jgi:hypothetical protein
LGITGEAGMRLFVAKHRCRIASWGIGTILVVCAHIALPATNTVTNINDSGAGSLRQAILDASPGDTINFAATVTGTISLVNGELLIDKDLTILGPGSAFLTVRGLVTSCVFYVTGGPVTVSDVTITGGGISGIFNGTSGVVTVTSCLLSKNGSGIFNDGTLAAIGCTFVGNVPVSDGGGLLNRFGTATLTNCTFTGNDARGFSGLGGGLMNYEGVLTLRSCTIASNSATAGGGIWNERGTIYVGNTIIANNSAILGGSDCGGHRPLTSAGYNLIRNTTGCPIATTNSITGQDPLLGPLANYGGATPTMALRANSPAIDKGKSFGVNFDQRGEPRFDNPVIDNATDGDGTDIGAYEAAELRITGVQQMGNDVRLEFSSVLDRNYAVQTNCDLVSGTWGSIPDNVTGNGGSANATVTNALSVSQGFLRIEELPLAVSVETNQPTSDYRQQIRRHKSQ